MLTFEIGNISSRLTGFLSSEAYTEIKDALAYAVPGAQYSSAVEEEKWDGIIRLFNARTRIMPTGCIGMAMEILEKHNLPYAIKDGRKRPDITKYYKLKSHITPRPYQLEAAQLALLYQRATIEAATGAGKSLIIAMIVARLGLPCVIYVNTKDLLYQMIDNLKQFIDCDESEIGQIGDGIIAPSRFTVTTVQTAHKALGVDYQKYDEEDCHQEKDIGENDARTVINTLENAQAIVIDEAQFLGSKTFQEVTKYSQNAYFRWSVSATPWRSDNADILIRAATGKIVCKITASYLIKKGYLVAPDITMIKMPREKVTIENPSYASIYKAKIVESETSNKIITDIALYHLNKGESVLILVQQIAHGKIILSKIKEHYTPEVIDTYKPGPKSQPRKVKEVELLQGDEFSDKRKKIIGHFRDKKIKILVATSLADCGLDIPSLDALILAGRGKSKTRIPQRIGRVIRSFIDKTRAWVYDFYDFAKYMGTQAKDRLEIYESEPEFRIHHHKYDKKTGIVPFLESLRKNVGHPRFRAVSCEDPGESHATE